MSLLIKVTFLLKVVSMTDKCFFHIFFVGYILGIQEFLIHIHPTFVPQLDQILLCFFLVVFFFFSTKPSADVGVRKLD